MANANSREILAIVDRETVRMRAIAPRTASKKPGPDKWCRREVLGHLIDSALNNHQRFVRAQLMDSLEEVIVDYLRHLEQHLGQI
jgi:hypothetical protein